MSAAEVVFAKPKVLVIEDSDDVRRIITRALNGMFETVIATNGREGLEKVLQGNIDLIITDIFMPEMTGDQMIAEIYKHENLRQIPILVVSGDDSSSVRVQLLKNGAQDYVLKPFSSAELLQRAQNLVRAKRLHEKLEQELSQKSEDMEELVNELSLRKRKIEELAETLIHSNHELEQFIFIASHNLQEPVRIVSTYVGLLGSRYDGKADSEVAEYMTTVIDNARRIQELLTSFVAYNDLRKAKRQIEAVDMQQILERIQILLSEDSTKGGCTITSSSLPKVKGHKDQLELVLWHLVTNAIKFKSSEAPVIKIEAVPTEGGRWLFSVRDNGIGFDMIYEKKIFEIFKRLHTLEAYEGTGMGLAVCKKIIERHGGKIWAKSAVGQGATFFFTLSAVEDEPL